MMMRSSQSMVAAVLLLTLLQHVQCFYVPYQEATEYKEGDRVPIFMNRLHSPRALASIDYSNLPVCNYLEEQNPIKYPSNWVNGLRSLHGDVVYDGPNFDIRFLQDQYCSSTCGYNLDTETSIRSWKSAIDRGFVYDIYVDAMPVGSRYEDELFITTNYWGGVPVGRRGRFETTQADDDLVFENLRYENTTSDDMFVFNHWNIQIQYTETSPGKYSILQTIIEPFSLEAADMNTQERLPATASCQQGSSTHTAYGMLTDIQPQIPEGFFRFTYDVTWVRSENGDPDKRWNKFLKMEGYEPLVQNTVVQVSCVVFAIIINMIVFGTLWTWVMRDLSYKPLMADTEEVSEDQSREVKLWPLSTRVFFAPAEGRGKQLLFCAALGQGAHLFVLGCVFLFFFQVGVIHMALGSRILEPAIVIYTVTSPLGGYTAAKLQRMFHGDTTTAVISCLGSSLIFPFIGMIVVWFCYDVFPNAEAPNYHAVASSWCFILLWLLAIVPLNLVGGFIGFKSGPLANFPCSAGTFGYNDLDLQQESDKADGDSRLRMWKKHRTLILFLTVGFLPMIGAFNAYAYGIAGPVYQGFYVSSKLQVFLPFLLFCFTSGGMSMFFFYRQLRAHNYAWWWPAFWCGASSGFYTFLLAMSWLIYNSTIGIAPARSVLIYFFWFLYVSTGISLVTGFIGVLCCVGFCRSLYGIVMRRCERD